MSLISATFEPSCRLSWPHWSAVASHYYLFLVGGEIAVMLTGVTGAGKSSACNFLFEEEVFEVGMGLISVTSKSGAHDTMIFGRKVRLIDTPGFCDDFEKEEEKVNELGKAVLLAKEGVHAIALVINSSHRFTSAEATALEEIELLGELWPFIFILFTAAKCYGATEQKQRDYILSTLDNPKCPEHLKTLMERVNRRFMMLENTDSSIEYRKSKITEFFTMVDSIYSTNKRLYTNYYFKKANELYQEAKRREQNKEEELRKAQEDVMKMSADMAATIGSMKSEQEKQQAIFQDTLSSLTRELREAQQNNQQLSEHLARMQHKGRKKRCSIM